MQMQIPEQVQSGKVEDEIQRSVLGKTNPAFEGA